MVIPFPSYLAKQQLGHVRFQLILDDRDSFSRYYPRLGNTVVYLCLRYVLTLLCDYSATSQTFVRSPLSDICHSADNFTKYSINAWAATMLAEKHGASPSRIWTILGTQEAIGVVSRLIVGMLFSSSKKDNTSLRPFSSRGWTSCIAFVIQSIAIGSAFAAFNTFQASIMFVVSAVAVGAHSVGFRPIYLEASPDHAGSISGFGNTIASFASAIGPVIVVTGNEAATVPLKDKNWSRVGLWMGVVNMVAALASLKIATAVPRPISNKNTGIFRKYSRS